MSAEWLPVSWWGCVSRHLLLIQGIFFSFCFILTCLGNCRNPDELSFLYLRINFLQFIFQKHPCAFLFGYKHSCVFLGIFQNNISFIKHCLLCLKTTMVQRGMGRLAKPGMPWIDTEIKSYVVLWHLTSDVHQNGLTSCSSCKICVSTSMCWEGKKKKSFLMIKNLCSIPTNQSVGYTTLTNWRIKIKGSSP